MALSPLTSSLAPGRKPGTDATKIFLESGAWGRRQVFWHNESAPLDSSPNPETEARKTRITNKGEAGVNLIRPSL